MRARACKTADSRNQLHWLCRKHRC